ncbi:MAG: bacteriophage holin [Nanoarchaeota archaeon]
MKKLDGQKIGIAVGSVTAIYMGALGLTAATLNWGSALVRTLSSVYIGYDASFMGMIIGALWGFLDGFILGYLFSWIYNKLE